MYRLAALTTATVMIAVTGFAASDVLMPGAPEVIRIEVAPEDLADCRQTLQEVGAMPGVADDGTPLVFDDTDELPSVVCTLAIDA